VSTDAIPGLLSEPIWQYHSPCIESPSSEESGGMIIKLLQYDMSRRSAKFARSGSCDSESAILQISSERPLLDRRLQAGGKAVFTLSRRTSKTVVSSFCWNLGNFATVKETLKSNDSSVTKSKLDLVIYPSSFSKTFSKNEK
jgi:hypothetical protein